MRRTKGGWLHPAIRWKLGEQGLQRFVGDPAGVIRVNEPGGIWDYLPFEPDLDINAYHKQFDFSDSRDTDTTNVWDESFRTVGSDAQKLRVNSWADTHDGHAIMASGDDPQDYMQYQEKTAAYYADSSLPLKALWFVGEMRTSGFGGSIFLGYHESDVDVLTSDASCMGFYYNFDEYGINWQFLIRNRDAFGSSEAVVADLDEPPVGLMQKFAFSFYESSPGEYTFVVQLESIRLRKTHFTVGGEMPLDDLLQLTVAAGYSGSGIISNMVLRFNFLKSIFEKVARQI